MLEGGLEMMSKEDSALIWKKSHSCYSDEKWQNHMLVIYFEGQGARVTKISIASEFASILRRLRVIHEPVTVSQAIKTR
jgi:hypothetical protein